MANMMELLMAKGKARIAEQAAHAARPRTKPPTSFDYLAWRHENALKRGAAGFVNGRAIRPVK